MPRFLAVVVVVAGCNSIRTQDTEARRSAELTAAYAGKPLSAFMLANAAAPDEGFDMPRGCACLRLSPAVLLVVVHADVAVRRFDPGRFHGNDGRCAQPDVPSGAAEALGHFGTRMVEKPDAHHAPSFVADTIRATAPDLSPPGEGVVRLDPTA